MEAWKRLRTGIAVGVLWAGPPPVEARATYPPVTDGGSPLPGGPGPLPVPGGKPSALPTVLVVPGSYSAERISGDGCWAQFYREAHFKGTQLNILGPVELRTMEGPFGADWKGLESAVVGPGARVTVFDDENLEDRSLVLEPGTHVPEFDELWGRGWLLNWFTDIKSVRVLCLPYRIPQPLEPDLPPVPPPPLPPP